MHPNWRAVAEYAWPVLVETEAEFLASVTDVSCPSPPTRHSHDYERDQRMQRYAQQTPFHIQRHPFGSTNWFRRVFPSRRWLSNDTNYAPFAKWLSQE